MLGCEDEGDAPKDAEEDEVDSGDVEVDADQNVAEVAEEGEEDGTGGGGGGGGGGGHKRKGGRHGCGR